MNITINHTAYIEEPVLIYKDGNLVDTINNSATFDDLRVQICEAQSEGWEFDFRGGRYEIDKNGRVFGWPEGLFDETTKRLSRLLRGLGW